MSEPHTPAEDADLLRDAREIMENDPEFAAMLFMTVESSVIYRAAQNRTSRELEHQRIALELLIAQHNNMINE